MGRGFMYPRSMAVRKGDRVMIVRGEGKSKSATRIAKVDRKARKITVTEKSTELPGSALPLVSSTARVIP